ncbi:nucleotide exchange factor GrpE [Bengtsoniella intestinalis]|uniref:nucleotide exchange factor GrpE n=1 Tax=Bengtsoniella intestinalis TaxID=3073143 RepID=UPI00391F1CE6
MDTNETVEPVVPEEEPIIAPEGEVVEEPVEQAPEAEQPQEDTFTLTRTQMEAMELAVKQLASASDQYARLGAEYENFRKRTAKEKETIYQDAKADTITPFLAVYDNLQRALAADTDAESPHRKGIEMMATQYQEILGKLGVTEMDCKGQVFDPEKHNAVMHIENPDLGENVVAEVFQAGFMLGDKVLRFAIVQVAN